MKLSIGAVTEYLNSRTQREKFMIIGFGIFALFVIDVALVIMPLFRYSTAAWPELSETRQELKIMKDDRDRKDEILAEWQKAKDALAEKEKRFIAPNESESVLKNISKLAQSSGIKVLSLTPAEGAVIAGNVAYEYYPIKINAVGGAHELGRFLAQLESATTFFRVKSVTIIAGTETPKHQIEILLEMIRKGGGR